MTSPLATSPPVPPIFWLEFHAVQLLPPDVATPPRSPWKQSEAQCFADIPQLAYGWRHYTMDSVSESVNEWPLRCYLMSKKVGNTRIVYRPHVVRALEWLLRAREWERAGFVDRTVELGYGSMLGLEYPFRSPELLNTYWGVNMYRRTRLVRMRHRMEKAVAFLDGTGRDDEGRQAGMNARQYVLRMWKDVVEKSMLSMVDGPRAFVEGLSVEAAVPMDVSRLILSFMWEDDVRLRQFILFFFVSSVACGEDCVFD